MAGQRPTIVANPAADEAFRHVIEELLAAGVTDIEVFQERLRERFPKAVARPRSLSGEQAVVWYVYRDGRWTAQATAGTGGDR